MADDQTRKSFDDAGDESGQTFESHGIEDQADGPSGENLSRHGGSTEAAEIPADIFDDEAEELAAEPVEDQTPGHADPQDVVIDDQQQLAEAEAVAARARSSRPVRRQRSSAVEETQEEQGLAEESEAQVASESVEAPRQSMPRPVRRPVKRDQLSEERVSAPAKRREKNVERSASSGQVAHRRTTPAAFVGQSAAELRKVIWPTSSQLSQYFVVVLLFVLFIVAYVGLLDPAFGWVLLKFLGK